MPIQSWSISNLNVSRTFPPALLYMPDIGTDGNASCADENKRQYQIFVKLYFQEYEASEFEPFIKLSSP